MKIKICGLTDPNNLLEVDSAQPDLVGFIFYPGSGRYMRNTLYPSDLEQVRAKKVGVFVNASKEMIIDMATTFKLDAIQLHGHETPGFCEGLKNSNLTVIKAFSVDQHFDFRSTKPFTPYCDFHLFDTRGSQRGGNGIAFDWKLLHSYDQGLPFFLSGGIGPDNISNITSLRDMNLYGIDLNSQVEQSIGIKDMARIKAVMTFIENLNNLK